MLLSLRKTAKITSTKYRLSQNSYSLAFVIVEAANNRLAQP